MSSMKVLLKTALFGSIFLLLPSSALGAGFNVINVITDPKLPGANEEVTIRLESYTTNLGASAIRWFVNKTDHSQGLALTEIKVRTGDFGVRTVVDVVIVTDQGERIDKQLVVAPAEVDVLWEALTYTPPFYKGKALPSFKSMVRVTAIPRFNSLTSDPKKYKYRWTYNRVSGLGEAVGKNSVLVPMGYDDVSMPVDVFVTLPGTDWSGSKYLSIPGSPAKVVLYEQAPLLGINFNSAWTSTPIETAESEFVAYAVPFFFSLDDIVNNRIVYRWEVNRVYTAPGLDARYLTIANPIQKDEDGVSVSNAKPSTMTVSFSAQNPVRILQEGRAQSTLTFTP